MSDFGTSSPVLYFIFAKRFFMANGTIRVFFFLALLGGLVFPAAAQEGEDDSGGLPIESDWSGISSDAYSPGDKIFTISLGVLFPTVFIGEEGILDNKVKMGGAGSLAYNYFLTSHIFVGGEIGGMFAPTVGKNMLYMIPMGVRVGYQFVVSRFEFPLSLMVGVAPQKYIGEGFFGLFAKPSGSVFWRFNPEWSFGLNAAWWFVPQWAEKTAYGNFLELTLAARYHF
jgi:hypothetical protein